MPREFRRGHRAKVGELTARTELYVGVRVEAPGVVFDVSCFGLDADERLSDDRYFVFFNQPESPEGAVRLLGAQGGDTESFRVDLSRVPARVRKLSFTATVDGAGQMSQVGPGHLRIAVDGQEVARYPFDGSEFSTERAVVLGDLYLRDVWRFAAVGQGFDGGLEALLKSFGGEVLEEEPPVPGEPPVSGESQGTGRTTPSGSWPAATPAPTSPPPAQVFTTPAQPAAVPPAPAHDLAIHAAPTIAAGVYIPPAHTVPPPAPAPAPTAPRGTAFPSYSVTLPDTVFPLTEPPPPPEPPSARRP